MSLLMEALKSAEKRKLTGPTPVPPEPSASEEAAATEFDLILQVDEPEEPPPAEPAPPPEGEEEFLPETPLELAPLEPAPDPPRPPPATAEPRPIPPPAAAREWEAEADPEPDRQQQQAENVFAAKQPLTPRPRKLLFLGSAGLLLLLAGVGQGYRLWQERRPPAIAISAPSVVISNPPAPSEPPTAPPSAEPPPEPAETIAPPVPEIAVEAKPSAAPPPEREKPKAPAKVREAIAPPPAEPKVIAPPAPPAATSSPGSGITITRTTQRDPLNEHLTTAYSAFIQGNLRLAEENYHAMLQADGNNRDALLGLAAIANKKNQAEEALRLYTRLLELDPNDGLAQAGVLAAGVASPQNEGRIKTLLARLPESDFLYFVLGNLYGTQSRWPEAEQAYFQAYQRNGANPDYAFNLAVSLEHIRQGKTAMDYYRKALKLAEQRPAAFDQVQAWRRLQALAEESNP